MARSLGILLVIILVVVVVRGRGGPSVRVVDPAQAYQGARESAQFTVRIPQGLPALWRCTSASDEQSGEGQLTLRVGYLTPTDEYAALVESDRPAHGVLADLVPAGATQTGAVDVGGTSWRRFPAKKSGETALVLVRQPVTYVVTGSAPIAELTALAGSLR